MQKELDTIVTEWNMHRIAPSRNSVSPRGRPFIMYHMPQVYGTKDYLYPAREEDINICKELCTFPENVPCDKDVYELCVIIMTENGLSVAQEPNNAIDLYVTLREKVLEIL